MTTEHTGFGYRGYIASRPIRGHSTPQHIQNLVIRDYAERNELKFKLSATEYAMPGCDMILRTVIDELSTLEGLILFSMFQLPQNISDRMSVYKTVLDSNCAMHAATESLALSASEDISRWEDIILVDHFSSVNELGATLWPM